MALMIAKTSAINMNAELGNLMKMTVQVAQDTHYSLSNTSSGVGCLGSDFILEAHGRDSFALPSPELGLCASRDNMRF